MSEKNLGTFEYGGYHFTPVRQFRKGEIEKHLAGDSRPWKMDAHYAMRNMRTDRSIQLPQYTYSGFFAAATDKDCDIFRCEETGRLYVPGQNELFGYKEPRQKSSVKATLSQAQSAVSENRADTAKKQNGPGRDGGER